MKRPDINKTLRKAKTSLKRGQHKKAQELYNSILEAFPQNSQASEELRKLNIAQERNTSGEQLESGLQQLSDLYHQGNMTLVVERSNQIINEYPNTFLAWHWLGLSSTALGMLEQAATAFKKTTQLNPRFAPGFNDLGVVTKELGHPLEAIEAFHQVLKLAPNDVEAICNLGNAHHAIGQLDKAIMRYEQALRIEPNHLKSLLNMGQTLSDLGHRYDALRKLDQALLIDPNSEHAFNAIGAILRMLGRHDDAIIAFRAALNINPDWGYPCTNLGTLYLESSMPKEAAEMFNRALSLDPNNPDAHNGIGTVFLKQRIFIEAEKAFRKAIALKPDFTEAFCNLGSALGSQNRPEEAVKILAQALDLSPQHELLQSTKLGIQASCCMWDNFWDEQVLLSSLGLSSDTAIGPFPFLSLEDNPKHHYLRSKRYAEIKNPEPELTETFQTIKPSKRIRVGYFSADFHNHASMYLMARVFELHNTDEFEVYAYSFGPEKNDAMRDRLIKAVTVFDDVSGMSDKQIAQIARQDGIDIAIDLKGYTEDTRMGIFTHRAAPVQMTFLGYPGTLAMPCIDYLIADSIVIASDQRNAYSERVIYLPHTYQPNDNTKPIAQLKMSRQEMGLPEDGFVFCSFNANYKITPVEFDIWMRLLIKIPGSVLWLIKSSTQAENNLRKEAALRGVNSTRIIFAEKMPNDEHLARHKLADLFIDTFNYNAHTTASDALWAGLPLVTKLGAGFPARVASSLLAALDLTELITETENDYETLIFELATHPEKLEAIRTKLANNRVSKPLFNSQLFTQHLESGYLQAYQKCIDGGKPEDIRIAN
jgi:protein O-GlcNAc transferase